jgi:hypothetical protein
MSPDLTTALGSLLADRELRRTLRRDPREAALRLGISEGELNGLDPEALEIQAESLVDKRRYEVFKRLPRSMKQLGARAPELFREFAEGFWPAGHRRHELDAARFADFLIVRGLPLCRSEGNCARFLAGTMLLSIGWARDVLIGGRPRPALEIFFRIRGRLRSYALYFGL